MATLLPTTASAKQCIWNKGGYVLDVRWFKPADLRFSNTAYAGSPVHSSDINNYMTISGLRPPVQVDQFPVAQGRCTNTDEVLTAVISVAGGWSGSFSPTKRCPTCEPRPSVESALVYMDFLLGEGPRFHVLGVRSTGLEGSQMPNERKLSIVRAYVPAVTAPGAELFLVTTPPTTHYIDFWGTADNPQWGRGGPITP